MLNLSAREMGSQSTTTGKQFTGKHMLAIMVSFFAIIVMVNGALAYFAMNSWTGLVVPNSYVASQTFNADTAKRLEAIGNGAKASIAVEQGLVVVRLNGKRDEALSASNLIAKLRHPVDARQELLVEFEPHGGGLYVSTKPLPAGSWIGDISADLGGYGRWVEAVRLAVGS